MNIAEQIYTLDIRPNPSYSACFKYSDSNLEETIAQVALGVSCLWANIAAADTSTRQSLRRYGFEIDDLTSTVLPTEEQCQQVQQRIEASIRAALSKDPIGGFEIDTDVGPGASLNTLISGIFQQYNRFQHSWIWPQKSFTRIYLLPHKKELHLEMRFRWNGL